MQISPVLSEFGVTFDGVVELPTHGGTLRALQFTLVSADSTPFELRVPGPNGTFSIRSSELGVSGQVRLFATRIQGNVLGLPLPVDYTPESPPQPPLVPPVIAFTDARIELVFIRCDRLTAAHLQMNFV
jgi:hypothetical protein